MSASVGEQLVQAMCDALNAPSTKPAITYRTRLDAFSKAELPVMVLFAVKDEANTESSNTILRKRTVRLECIVEGEPPADVAIDALYVYAVKTLDDSTIWNPSVLGVRRVQEKGIQWETEASYQDACAAVIDFEIVYATTASDPTLKR